MSEYLSSDLFLDQLAAEGTKFIFETPGPNSRPVVKSLERRSDIKRIVGLHESTAVGMAIGYAQATGKPGVAHLESIAGLSNGLSGLLNAWTARIPLIVTVAQHDNRVINEFHPADDLVTLPNSFCKWTCEIRTAEEIPRVLRRAFHEALSAPMGPVVVSLPVNLLREPVSQRVIMPPRSSPLGPADSNFLKRTVQLLSSAKKPAIIAGNEVSQYRARKEVVALAEVLGCPVFSEPLPTGLNFPNRHPLFAGTLPPSPKSAHELLNGHDVVVILGMQTRRPTNFDDQALVPSAAVVAQINMDSSLSGQSLPCHFSAHADLAESLSQIRAEIQLAVDSQWVQNAKGRAKSTATWVESLKAVSAREQIKATGEQKVSLKWFLTLLDSTRPVKSVIVNDCTGEQEVPLLLMDFERSSSYISNNGRSLGYGAPAALGAQLADPAYTTICLTSDASILRQLQSLWTAAHYNIPAKLVVLNRRSLDLIDQDAGDVPAEQDLERCVQIQNPSISYLEVAAAMGISARAITRPSEMEPALEAMFAHEGPFLVDLHL